MPADDVLSSAMSGCHVRLSPAHVHPTFSCRATRAPLPAARASTASGPLWTAGVRGDRARNLFEVVVRPAPLGQPSVEILRVAQRPLPPGDASRRQPVTADLVGDFDPPPLAGRVRGRVVSGTARRRPYPVTDARRTGRSASPTGPDPDGIWSGWDLGHANPRVEHTIGGPGPVSLAPPPTSVRPQPVARLPGTSTTSTGARVAPSGVDSGGDRLAQVHGRAGFWAS